MHVACVGAAPMKAPSVRTPFPVLESIAAVVVVAGYVFVAYQQAQQDRRNLPYSDTQSSYDAGQGGYRALFEVLQREHIDVQRFERHPAFLDGSIDVYVLSEVGADPNHPVGPLAGADIESTAAWVRNGGRLVLIGGDYDGQPALKTPFIDSVGAHRDRARPVISTPLAQGVRSLAGSSANRIPLARSIGQAPIALDRSGIVVSAYQLGKGEVIIVTDPTLFQNRNLARADNARLALDLVTAGLGPHPVVAFDEFSHGYQIGETLWSVLPKPVQAALVIVCAALFALLISTFFRFGPVARLPVDTERTSAEYLASMAALLARCGEIRKAIREVADAP